MSKTVGDIIKELKRNPKSIMVLYRWLAQMEYSWEASEKICGYLLDHFEIIKEIPCDLTYAHVDGKEETGWRYLEYRRDNRKGYPQKPKKDKKFDKEGEHTRGEDYLAMDFYRLGRKNVESGLECVVGLGYILDYQMCIGGDAELLTVKEDCIYNKNNMEYPYYGIPDPDPDKINEKDPVKRLFKPGKCDLIAYDKEHLVIYELKKEYNDEPMIRAVMEAYTYLQMLDTNLATKNLRKHYNKLLPEGIIPWEARVLLYKGGTQYKEYMKKDDSNLRKLMNKLKVTPAWYTTGFTIEE